jgi:hypothetical protein
MNRFLIFVAALSIPAMAQAPQQAQANPLSTWLRNAFTGNRNNIMRAAERMPEENYGMRPGAQQEVRTYGQQVTHAAVYNFLWCSQAKGEKNPDPGNLDKLTSKAEIIKIVNESFTYCESAYNALTDASGSEIIEITQENGRQRRIPRMGLLAQNYGHNNEIYGSLVVYLRMKNIVPRPPEPPAAEKR